MPYIYETWNGAAVWFHPLQGQFCTSPIFSDTRASYTLSHVRAMTRQTAGA